MKSFPVWICAAAAACTAWAVETKVWKQSEAADFEKGKREALALSSDGALFLAPVWKRLADLETPLVWSVLPAPGGAVHAAPATARSTASTPQAAARFFADLGSGSVYALACGAGRAPFMQGSVRRAKCSASARTARQSCTAQLEPRYIWALVAGEGAPCLRPPATPARSCTSLPTARRAFFMTLPKLTCARWHATARGT